MASPSRSSGLVKAAVVVAALGFLAWEVHAVSPEARVMFRRIVWAIRGEAAIPSLARSLDRTNEPLIQAAAASALRAHGATAVPAAIAMLKSQEAGDRLAAATALQAIGREAREACPVLAEFVKTEQNAEIRLLAVGVLRLAGTDSAAGIAGLVHAVKDADPAVRLEAVTALERVDASNSDAVDALAAALKDSDARVRQEAAESIGSIRPKRKDVVLALIETLADPVVAVRGEAAEALGSLAPQAEIAAPALIPLLQDPASRVRIEASRTLVLIGKPSVEPLVRQLSEKGGLNSVTIKTLGQIGPAAGPAAPRLERLLKEAPESLRGEIEEALATIRKADGK